MSENNKHPAHRPSRRDEIVQAAIRVFAEKGYAEASISDIAEAADVAITAVYYHFTGKDDLFAAAMKASLDSISEVVVSVRPNGTGFGSATTAGLNDAIDAVWDWIDENPLAAHLVHVQLPGATPQLTSIRQAFLELHERRAYDYLHGDPSADGRPAAARTAAGILTMRTLIDSLMAVHAMRLLDGPLSTLPPSALRKEVHHLAQRLLLD
jgi:AcrR family transcriptional regulator